MKPGAPHMSAPSKQTKGVGSMRRQNKMKIQRRRRRKLFWLFAAAAVCALLFEEQVAVLYVLSTLAICGLMIVVAFSNLEARDAEMQTAAIREAADNMTKNSRDLSRGKRRAA
jgi:Flp pilus assembly protein TadB